LGKTNRIFNDRKKKVPFLFRADDRLAPPVIDEGLENGEF
jgi:hypothetical protein